MNVVSSEAPSSNSAEAAACPPPLLWQDVRREFLAQSEARTVTSAVGPVSVRSWGTGSPLYLLPAFASPAEVYGLMIWLLREDFRCVTVEPSARESSAVRSMGDYVEVLFAAADELGDESIALFGADFGGAWALEAAQQRPERIARLALLGGFARRRLSLFESGLGRLCGLSRRNLSAIPGRETLQRETHLRWFPPFDATRWQYYLEASGSMSLKELSRRARAVAEFDLRDRLGSITVPTLVIRTEGEGRLAAGCQEELARGLPNAKTEWLHTTGQLAYLTHPHRMAKLIRTFLAETSVGNPDG